jgi:hypothetical protein
VVENGEVGEKEKEGGVAHPLYRVVQKKLVPFEIAITLDMI